METQDKIEEKFRDAFSDFESDPPPQVWENLQKIMHPIQQQESRRKFALFGGKFHFWRYHAASAVAGLILVIFLVLFYFLSDDYHSIKGSAFAGEARLCRGTAVLFQVLDRTKPWDSVNYYRSALVDDNGFFHFKRVGNGNYLLRIEPEQGSGHAKDFKPSWFDMHEESTGAHLLNVNDDITKADVHLCSKDDWQKD